LVDVGVADATRCGASTKVYRLWRSKFVFLNAGTVR